MAKLIKLTKDTGRYVRDFSIVVAGIAVTLWIQSLLTNHSERKDTKLYLNALKMELHSNRVCLDSILLPSMEASMRYVEYILAHDVKTANPDTLRKYKYVYHHIAMPSYFYDAFEMFKTSGNMRFITDKEMLQSIWSVYSDLKRFDAWICKYYDEKLEEVRKDNRMEVYGKSAAIPMYDFYMSYSGKGEIEYNIVRNCKGISADITETLRLLEKEMQ